MHSSSPVHFLLYLCWIADELRKGQVQRYPVKESNLICNLYFEDDTGEYHVFCASFMSETALGLREYSADDVEKQLRGLAKSNRE